MQRSLLSRFFYRQRDAVWRCAMALVAALAVIPDVQAQSISLGPLSIIDGADEGSGGDTGLWADFQNDPMGGQHVVYYDQTNGDLRYAHRGSTSRPWELQTVDAVGNVGVECKLDLGPQRVVPMTANFINGSNQLTVNTVFSPPFIKEMIGGQIEPQFGPPATYEIVSYTSSTLVFIEPAYAGPTASNVGIRTYYYHPTIIYRDASGGLGKVKVAIPDSINSWILEEVAPATDTTTIDTGYAPAIAVDQNFDLHVAFQDRTTSTSGLRGVLKYGNKVDTFPWTFQTRDNSLGAALTNRLLVNQFNNPVIVYHDESDGNLYSQTRVGILQEWLTGRQLIDDAGAENGARALDMEFWEGGNRIMLAYHVTPTTGSTLDQIQFSNAKVNAAGIPNWNLKTSPLSRQGIGSYLSIAHGVTTGTQKIVYYDQNSGNLKMLEGTGVGITNFKPEVTLDPGPQAGLYCSADYNDVDDQLYVAYYNADIGGLQMVGWDGSAVTGTSYIDGQKVGRYSDIVYTDTEIIVAYHHDAEGSLRVARWPIGMEPGDGTNVVVDNASPDVGEYCSVTADQAGRVFIAYYDRTNTNLKYAAWNGMNWSTRTIVGETTTTEQSRNVGEFCKTMVFEDGTTSKLGVAFYDADARVPVFGEADLPPFDPNMLVFSFLQQPLTVDAGSGRYLSMDYSTSGTAQLAFYNEVTRTPDWVQTGGVAQHIGFDPLAPLDVNGWYTAVGWNPLMGRAEVAFHDVSNGQLKYATPRGAGNWDIEVLDDFGDTGYYNQLRFDPVTQYQYLIFYNQSLGELQLVSKPWTGTLWTNPIPINGADRSFHPAFLPDPTGRLLLSFHQLDTANLIFTVSTTPPNITGVQHPWE